MSCCFGKNTDGLDPKKSLSNQSDPSSGKGIIPVNKPQKSKIEYSITVKTGDFRNSGTNGPVYINIFGRDDKQTEDLVLSANGKAFSQGCTRKFQVNAIDIGKPQRIIIRHEDKSTGWYVDYIEISVHNFLVRFVANRWLNRLKNDRKIEAELFGSEQPAVIYDIEVKTGDEQDAALDSPVYMQIYGTTTATPKIFLESKNPSFTKNSTSKFSISSNNVGEIQRIVIGHEGLGNINDWYLKHVKVEMLAQQQEFTVDKWLSPTKDDQRLFVELSHEKPRSPSPPAPTMYLITIQTADVPQIETAENIEMIVRGAEGQIAKILLKYHAKLNDKILFQKGNLDEFAIEHKDIGKIESITIGFSDSTQKIAWFLEYVDVKHKEIIYHFRAQCWLSSRLGSNFSWMTIKPDESHDDINYKVIIETGQSGIDANVVLCIFGDEETTANLGLRTTKDGADAKFDKDSILEFDLKAVDVGKIKKINIGHDGKGTEQQWFLRSIKIDKKDEQYLFKADRWLSEEKDDHKTYIDLSPDEPKSPSTVPEKDQATYIITIVTSSEDHAGTDSGVLMTIIGDKDITKQFQLTKTKQGDKASFEAGNTNEFEMELDNVGNINKINIGQDGKGTQPSWHLETVRIEKGAETYNFVAKKRLDQSTSFIDLTPTPIRKTPSPEPVKVETPSPEPVKVETPSVEPVKVETPRSPTPEQKVTQRSSTPEQKVTQRSSTPEKKVTQRSSTPEKKVTQRSSTPEQKVTQRSSTPEQKVTQRSSTPEQKVTQRSSTPEQKVTQRSSTPEKKVTVKEATYKVLLQTDSHPNLYIIIYGQKGETNKINLKGENTEFKTTDVGKISKIILGQDETENGVECHIDNVTIKRADELTTFNAERTIGQNDKIELVPSAIPKRIETIYKILIQTGALQEEGDDSNLCVTVFGQNGQTKKMSLKQATKPNKKLSLKKNEKIEVEFKANDVGKITKIVLSQDASEQGVAWHIDNITIKRGTNTATFNVERKIEQNAEVEVVPSPIPKKSETPRKSIKSSDTISKTVAKTKDADYEIITSTGDQAFDVPVTIKLRGENGTINIPLNKTKSGDKPFQSKSTDEFTSRTTDVGKIKRITIEHDDKNTEVVWHLKTIQLKRGNETYNFVADVRLDCKENKVNLYPVGAFYGHQKEDYVQSELRRLRENLRSESSKLRPPTHKAHEPFVFNDLSPYFDTSPVERAIYSPLETPPGYYTRVTSLRIVEPWEAYGMDHGDDYKLLKQRKGRSFSTKRSTSRPSDDSIDRKQGSTHLPKFPRVDIHKPAEYSRVLNMNDVPRIRSLIRSRYTAQAEDQMEKDYKRTRDDLYRMQLDHLAGYHESNRDNMVQIYHSYLENTPGSKKALRELCDQLANSNTPKSSVEAPV